MSAIATSVEAALMAELLVAAVVADVTAVTVTLAVKVRLVSVSENGYFFTYHLTSVNGFV